VRVETMPLPKYFQPEVAFFESFAETKVMNQNYLQNHPSERKNRFYLKNKSIEFGEGSSRREINPT
jgi:hypothetical protein